MKAQVDQSIKIEDTAKDTILAFSNDISATVLISRKIKRQLQKEFRKLGQPRLFVYRTFAAGIVLLIKDHLRKIDVLVIDIEYQGQERLIRDMILEMLKKLRRKQPHIYFRRIGRKAKAHKIAYSTHKRKLKPNLILKLRDLKKLVF